MKKFGLAALVFAVGAVFAASLILAPEAGSMTGDFLPLAACWLALFGAAFSAFALSKKRPAVEKGRGRAGIVLYPLFLTVWIGAATFATLRYGTPRCAANMFWTVGIFPLVYFFALVSARHGISFRRAALSILLAAALAESVFALFCYAVKDPALRAEYRANPEKTLADNGIYFEPGSPERTLFENRLLNSTEPLGTYGLTNTLAGVLVPVLALLTGIFFWNGALYFSAVEKSERKKRLGVLGAATAAILPLAVVLILTKSRSGYLAFLFGAVFLFFAVMFSRCRSKKIFWLGALTLPALFIVSALGAWGCGVLDKEVFTEAKKSLGFRLDYWEGSARMIAERPVFGVGPGNFQACYPKYMNASASEVVADPHNFLFEWAALFGIPAAILFCLFILALTIRAFRSEPDVKSPAPPNGRFPTVLSLSAFFVGVGLSFALSLSLSTPVDFDFLLGAVPAGAAALILARFLFAEPIPKPILLAALLASLVNLSAAGGIFFPPIMLTLALFAALIAGPSGPLPLTETPLTKRRVLTAAALMISTLLGIGLIGHLIFWRRVEKGAVELLETKSRGATCAQMFDLAKEPALFYSVPLMQQQVHWFLAAWSPETDEQYRPNWRGVVEQLFKEAPQSAPLRFWAGKEELAAYERTRNEEFLTAAAEAFSEASARFPTNAEYRAYWGLTLRRLGRTAEADREIQKALELDNAMPHQDRKLSPALRKTLQK